MDSYTIYYNISGTFQELKIIEQLQVDRVVKKTFDILAFISQGILSIQIGIFLQHFVSILAQIIYSMYLKWRSDKSFVYLCNYFICLHMLSFEVNWETGKQACDLGMVKINCKKSIRNNLASNWKYLQYWEQNYY